MQHCSIYQTHFTTFPSDEPNSSYKIKFDGSKTQTRGRWAPAFPLPQRHLSDNRHLPGSPFFNSNVLYKFISYDNKHFENWCMWISGICEGNVFFGGQISSKFIFLVSMTGYPFGCFIKSFFNFQLADDRFCNLVDFCFDSRVQWLRLVFFF